MNEDYEPISKTIFNDIMKKYSLECKLDIQENGVNSTEKCVLNNDTLITLHYNNKTKKGEMVYARKIDNNSKYVTKLIIRHPELFKEINESMKSENLYPRIYPDTKINDQLGTVFVVKGNLNEENKESLGKRIRRLDDDLDGALNSYRIHKFNECPYIVGEMLRPFTND